jgi:prepilin-type N-terminal cleavage/methylation domain-containing protein
MRINRNQKRGFSLVEVAVTLVIIAILAAIATPSLFAFLRQGQQTNRDNIARTLYLAAQSQLTQLRITRGLESAVSAEPGLAELITVNGEEKWVVRDGRKVYDALNFGDDALPDDEVAKNRDLVGFIGKGTGAPAGLMQTLLSTVNNNEVTNNPILIEFNIHTGVILSVFYSDRMTGNTWTYTGGATDQDNVFGGRGMGADGYADAGRRDQGYYGVTGTGELDPEFDDVYMFIYDSADMPLPDSNNRNILYAELLIPSKRAGERFDVSISHLGITIGDIYSKVNGLNVGFDNRTPDGLYIIKEGAFDRIFLILDFVTGDTENLSISIVPGLDPLEEIWGEIVDVENGIRRTSNSAHPYFSGINGGGSFSIKSARHLYNIRHLRDDPAAAFSLDAAEFSLDVAELDLEEHEIANFDPIPDFEGLFEGNGNKISNMKIGVDGNAGLFASMIGTAQNLVLENPKVTSAGENAGAVAGVVSGSVSNVTVIDPSVTGKNAGAIAGILDGTVSRAFVRFDDAGIFITGEDCAGGIAGELGGTGKIENVTFVSEFNERHIQGAPVAIGGIAGRNSGEIENVLFLALAPENGDGDRIPITVDGTGTVDSDTVYYLSGTPIRPEEDAAEGFIYYNDPNDCTGEGTPISTLDLYSENPLGWYKYPGLDVECECGDEECNRVKALCKGNLVYPYPFIFNDWWQTVVHAPPFWPIVEGDTGSGGLMYYELYTDNTVGYARYQDGRFAHDAVLPQLATNASDDNRIVRHEGYALYVSGGLCVLTINDLPPYTFNLETAGNAVTLTHGEVNYSCPVVRETDTNMAWVYFPNAFWDAVCDGSDITISLTVGGTQLIVEGEFNPLFGPSAESIRSIRSPRHMDNIDKSTATLAWENYTQRLDMDFGEYRVAANFSAANVITPTGVRMPFNSAVVEDTFSGTYNGGGTRILDLRIGTVEAPAGDNAGLFAVNEGNIRGISLINAIIRGTNYAGGIAGVNRGNIGTVSPGVVTVGSANMNLDTVTVSGTSYVGGITGYNDGGTITDSTLIFMNVSGTAPANTYVGGIAGRNSGEIRRSLVGLYAGDRWEYNIVTGSQFVGGITGRADSGTLIEICYVEGTRVGAATATNVGGIAGYLDGGTIRNVFYNYSDMSPRTMQPWGPSSVAGVSASTGGLVGYHNAGVLSNSYSTAYFTGINETRGYISGGRSASVPNYSADDHLNYLGGIDLFNPGNFATAIVGTRRNVAGLRDSTTADLNAGFPGTWQQGSGSGVSAVQVPTSYTYPRLMALQEPRRWPYPMPAAVTFSYYEIYEFVNPMTEGYYGLWAPGSDRLDYRPEQRVLEDGYIISTGTLGNSARVRATRLNGGAQLVSTQGQDDRISTWTRTRNIGGVDYQVFNMKELETLIYRVSPTNNAGAGNAILPLRIWITTVGGGASFGDPDNAFNGYLNPLFGKSIYTIQEFNSIQGDPIEYFTKKQYAIRTPRHLRNIGTDASTLEGNYLQEIDIDFRYLNSNAPGARGYCYYSSAYTGSPPTGVDTNCFNISKSIITNSTISPSNSNSTLGNTLVFNGSYTAYSPFDYNGYTRSTGTVRAIKNLSLPNSLPATTSTPQGGNIGIFPAIGPEGKVSSLILRNNTVSGTTGPVGGLAGVNNGTIRNITIENGTTNSVTGVAGGLVGINNSVRTAADAGGIAGIIINGVTVGSGGGAAGGAVGVNNGTLELHGEHDVVNLTVSGGNDTGGIAGQSIDDNSNIAGGITVKNAVITGAGNVGGIAGQAGHNLDNFTVSNITVTATGSNAGGIAGSATGGITNCYAENVTVSGTGDNVGGIAGIAGGNISQSAVLYSTVTGAGNVGGVVGVNNATRVIELCQVIETTVGGTSMVGGVAGSNTGTIRDSFFLSTASPGTQASPTSPVTASAETNVFVGGIAGNNTGGIERVFYLAPAPVKTLGSGDTATTYYYPIRGAETIGAAPGNADGNPVHGFYLHGNRHRIVEQGIEGGDWTTESYNRPAEIGLIHGGGTRLYTSFMDIEFIELLFAHNAFTASGRWVQGSAEYPYPLLTTMIGEPGKWPETDGPVRDDQMEYPEWGDRESINVGSIDFINGDFDMDLVNPNNPSQTHSLASAWSNSALGSSINNNTPTSSAWGTSYTIQHQAWVQGWNTRPVNPADTSLTYTNGSHRWLGIEFQNISATGDSGRARRDYRGLLTGIYAELNADVQGTLYQIAENTIPGTQSYYSFYHTSRHENPGNPDRMTFYLSGMYETGTGQDGGYDYTRKNASGNGVPTPIRPAVTPRGGGRADMARVSIAYGMTPEFYDPNIGSSGGQNFNRYLYDVWLEGSGHGITFWSDVHAGVTGPSNMSLSVSNRGAGGNNTVHQGVTVNVGNILEHWGLSGSTYTINATVRTTGEGTTSGTRLTVHPTNNNSNDVNAAALHSGWIWHNATFSLSFTGNNPTTRIRTVGTNAPPFIIDNITVTVAGIVVYDMRRDETHSSLNALATGTGAASSTSGHLQKSIASLNVSILGTAYTGTIWIPQFDVNNINDLPVELSNDARDNVIGYWHVAISNDVEGSFPSGYSEWKQYYGLYTIPEGQTITEFAFESNSARLEEGNYLAGVSFTAPGFVSVDKYVMTTNAAGLSTGEQAEFVQPNEILAVEIALKNWGGVAVNVALTDPMVPYDAYVGPVGLGSWQDKAEIELLIEWFREGVDPTQVDPYRISVVKADYVADRGGSLKANLDSPLLPGEQVRMTFYVQVRENLHDDKDNSARTLHYHYSNQAFATYTDSAQGFAGHLAPYTAIEKSNASHRDSVMVHIDPINLIKDVKLADIVSDASVDSFAVTMDIEDRTENGSVNAVGMVTIILPPYLKLTEAAAKAMIDDYGATVTEVAGGFTRIVIPNANLPNAGSATSNLLSYGYNLQPTGNPYKFGIGVDSVLTSYRYIFFDSESVGMDPVPVLLTANPTAIGFKVNLPESTPIVINTGELTPFDSGLPGNKIIDLADHNELFVNFLDNIISDGGYTIVPRVVLHNATGEEEAILNAQGQLSINGNLVAVRQDEDGVRLIITPMPDGGQEQIVAPGQFHGYTSGNFTIRYSVNVQAIRPGIATIDLSSEIREITVQIRALCVLCNNIFHQTCDLCGLTCTGTAWHEICGNCDAECNGTSYGHNTCADCGGTCDGTDYDHMPCVFADCECLESCECFDASECLVDCSCACICCNCVCYDCCELCAADDPDDSIDASALIIGGLPIYLIGKRELLKKRHGGRRLRREKR